MTPASAREDDACEPVSVSLRRNPRTCAFASLAVLRTQSDERLVALARAGNEHAFEAIVERYRRPLLRHARRLLTATARGGRGAAGIAVGVDGVATRRRRARAERVAAPDPAQRRAQRAARRGDGESTWSCRTRWRPATRRRTRSSAGMAMRRTLAGVAALPEHQREACCGWPSRGARRQTWLRRSGSPTAPWGSSCCVLGERCARRRPRSRRRVSSSGFRRSGARGDRAAARIAGLAGGAGGGAVGLSLGKLAAIVAVAGTAATGPALTDRRDGPRRPRAAKRTELVLVEPEQVRRDRPGRAFADRTGADARRRSRGPSSGDRRLRVERLRIRRLRVQRLGIRRLRVQRIRRRTAARAPAGRAQRLGHSGSGTSGSGTSGSGTSGSGTSGSGGPSGSGQRQRLERQAAPRRAARAPAARAPAARAPAAPAPALADSAAPGRAAPAAPAPAPDYSIRIERLRLRAARGRAAPAPAAPDSSGLAGDPSRTLPERQWIGVHRCMSRSTPTDGLPRTAARRRPRAAADVRRRAPGTSYPPRGRVEVGECASHLGYVLMGFPRVSETFIASELLRVERAGVPVRLFVIKPVEERERGLRHPVVDAIRAEPVYLPDPRSLTAPLHRWRPAHLRAFAPAIRRTLRAPAARPRPCLRDSRCGQALRDRRRPLRARARSTSRSCSRRSRWPTAARGARRPAPARALRPRDDDDHLARRAHHRPAVLLHRSRPRHLRAAT